jgi:hypothetical protein
MDPFTVAGIVALVLVGIFNKTGEVIAEGSIEQLKQRLSQKSPETLKQLQSASEGDAESLGVVQTRVTLFRGRKT